MVILSRSEDDSDPRVQMGIMEVNGSGVGVSETRAQLPLHHPPRHAHRIRSPPVVPSLAREYS